MDWCEYGDAHGYPVFWLHGVLSSKLEVAPFEDIVARSALRVIAVNRPGIGRSSLGGRRYTATEWVGDLVDLADELGVREFAIVAFSGASIYAYTAKSILRDRVSRISVVSGTALSTMPRRGRETAQGIRLLEATALRAPFFARRMIKRTLGLVSHDPDQASKELVAVYRSSADREILFGPLRDGPFASLIEAGSQGPNGIIADLAAIGRSRPPSIRTVSCNVMLWHGGEDQAISVRHAHWMADELPSAELVVWPTSGHLRTIEEWAEVCKRARPN